MAIDGFKNETPTLSDNINPKEITLLYKPTANDVYFAFIDVLGFKYTYDVWQILKKENVNDLNSPDQKYKHVFNYYFALMGAAKFMQTEDYCYAGQTSDSLYFYTERSDYLMSFIKIFSVFNKYAMTKDVFFRGGIAQGKLYKKQPHQFYGKSVIDAYLLESEIAKKPAIYMDAKTGPFLYENFNKKGTLAEKSIVRQDTEGRYFIKPFNLVTNEDIVDLMATDTILKEVNDEEVKKIIMMNKERFEYQPKTYMKYIFLENEFKEYEESKQKQQNRDITEVKTK